MPPPFLPSFSRKREFRNAAPYRHSRVSGNPEMPDWECAGLWQYRSGFPLAREGRFFMWDCRRLPPYRRLPPLYLGDKLQQLGGVERGFHVVAVGGGDARKGMVVLADDVPFRRRPS